MQAMRERCQDCLEHNRGYWLYTYLLYVTCLNAKYAYLGYVTVIDYKIKAIILRSIGFFSI